MENEPYGQVCTDINDQLVRRLERRDDVRLQFAAQGTAAAVLHRENIKLWFGSLGHEDLAIDETTFAERIHERNLYNFLTILIFITCPIEAARQFVARLVAVDDWPAFESLSRLPASLEQLNKLFTSSLTVFQFNSVQAIFCAVILHKREVVRVAHPDLQRLPYLSEQPLAEGSFGKVYKVRIARGHLHKPHSSRNAGYNTEPLDLARKDYLVTQEFRAQDEWDVMDKILGGGSRKCANIVKNYGSLDLTGSTYSLFMPLAICDLRAYMMELRTTRPSSLEDKSRFIRCAVGLAEGLSFLHNDIRTDLEDLVCYHMDLKPDNILIFRENGQYIWKLSDFGMARVKIRHRSGQHREEEKDFNSWFVQRLRPNREPSAPGTVNRRGEGTYLAPESMSSTASMKTPSDVWSLGCVLSVLFAYLDDGSDGVQSYRSARVDHSRADGYDRFFIATPRFMQNQVHPTIDRWHEKMIRAAKSRSIQEGEAVSCVLKSLEGFVFRINPQERKTARSVAEMLRKAHRMSLRSDADIKLEKNYTNKALHTRWTSITGKFRSGPPRETILTQHVQGWYHSRVENYNYKGCQISPDGSLIVYWSDVKIVLFTSQSLSPAAADIVVPAAEHTLQVEFANCIWKSVRLAQNYLVASTSGPNFQCFIFDLEGGRSVDVSLDHWVRISEPDLPEIQKLAITPDAETLICSLRHKDQELGPASILHARIADLRRYHRGQLSPQIGVSAAPPWRIVSVEWAAAEIRDIRSSTGKDVYLIVQPELTYRSQEHHVHVVCLSLQTEKYVILKIEAQGLDTSTTVALFTTFANFHQANRAVAVISREKRLLIQQMPEEEEEDDEYEVPTVPTAFREPPSLVRAMTHMTNGLPPKVYEIQREISRYRILRLVVSRDDRKLYCIGTTIASHKLLLLSVDVPTSSSDELVVTELAQIGDLGYDDRFTARLAERGRRSQSVATRAGRASVGGHLENDNSNHVDDDGAHDEDANDDDDGTYVLVAALVGRGRKAIYRVRLSDTGRAALPVGLNRRTALDRPGGGLGLGTFT